ncbi:major facilitator superfamily domain-containing protein, partial [Chaetomium strumarium]
PQHWRIWRKNTHVLFVNFMTFFIQFSAGMIVTSLPEIMSEFGAEDRLELSSYIVLAFVLGHLAEPLLITPLSRIYGRSVVSRVCNSGFVLSTLLCSYASSLATLIFFRSMAGIFGGGALSNGTYTMKDLKVLWGKTGLLHELSGLLGFILGPVCGGYISDGLGWRRTFALLAGAAAAVAISMVVVSRETYIPALLRQKVAHRRRETGNRHLRSALDSGLSPSQRLWRDIVRPFPVLFSNMLCTVYTCVGGIMYGLLYVMLTTIGLTLTRFYLLRTDGLGIYYLGLGGGCLLGWVSWLEFTKQAGVMEARLWPVFFSATVAMVGFGLCASTDNLANRYPESRVFVAILAMGGHIFV